MYNTLGLSLAQLLLNLLIPMPAPILIIGAGSGIARAVVRAYAARGGHILVTSRRQDEADRLAADATLRGAASATGIAFEPTDLATHTSFLARVHNLAPTGPLLTLIAYGTMAPQTEAQANAQMAAQQIAVNYTSVILLGEALYPLLPRGATLAVISSVAGDRGRQSNYLYGSTKAGISAWLQGLRNRAFHDGKHILTIKPGFVATPMTAGLLKEGSPLVATPDQVAQDILAAIDRRRDVLYTRWFWRWIMAIITRIPEGLFKKLRL